MEQQDLPIRFPLLVSAENRDGTQVRDARLINAYVEKDGKELFVVKRPCISVGGNVAGAATGRGAHNWNGDVFWVFGTSLYKNGVLVTAGMSASGGVYTFSECLGSNPRLVIQNSAAMYTYSNSTGFTTVPTTSTVTTTGTLVTGSAVITAIPSTAGISAGADVSGTYVPAGAQVLTVDSGVQVTLTVPITAQYITTHNGTTNVTGANTIQLGAVAPSPASVPLGSTMTVTGFAGYTFVVTAVTALTITGYSLGFPGAAAGTACTATVIWAAFPDNLTFLNPGLPSTTLVPGTAYLNGTTYVMSAASYVYGDEMNDPTRWPPLTVIGALSESDPGVRLTKQLTYIVAMKAYSIEMFYDAGNPTGSPLRSAPGNKISVGCKHADSVREAEGVLFWLAQTRAGAYSVMRMEGLKASAISTPAIERLLYASDYSFVRSWLVRISGHLFYGLTLSGSGFTGGAITLVWDDETQHWGQWDFANTGYVDATASYADSQQRPLLQDAADGAVYILSSTTYADTLRSASAVIPPVDIYTPNWDAETKKYKRVYAADFVGDQTEGSVLQVRVSDDDYQTWSNFRMVDMAKKRPFLKDWGTFRRRAMHIRHEANTPFRIKAVELQVEIGTM